MSQIPTKVAVEDVCAVFLKEFEPKDTQEVQEVEATTERIRELVHAMVLDWDIATTIAYAKYRYTEYYLSEASEDEIALLLQYKPRNG